MKMNGGVDERGFDPAFAEFADFEEMGCDDWHGMILL
jgi:hypothetical protein